MAEKYLEQAVITLASTFVDGGDALTASIPDLSGTLTGIGMHMAALNSSLRHIVERQRSQEENANWMRQRIVELETLCAEAHLRLELLTNSRDGVVSWAALNPLVDEMAKKAEVRQVEERCNVIEQKQTNSVTRSEIQPFRADVSQQLEALEKRLSHLEERHVTFSKSASRKLDQVGAVSEELMQAHSSFQIATDNAHTRIRDAVASSEAALTEKIKQVEASTSDNLGQSLQEIVKCLSKHSQALEDINNRESRWQENTVNVSEVKSLRKEMISLKREMEASSYRVHEVYSKCLSIATLAGSSSGRATRDVHGGDGSCVQKENESLADSSNKLGLGLQSNRHTDNAKSSTPLATTLEEQISALRADVLKLQSSKTINDRVDEIWVQVREIQRSSKKTDVLLRNLLFVFSEGKPERLEKLVRSLAPLSEPSGVRPPLVDLTSINSSAIPIEENDSFFHKTHALLDGLPVAPPLGDMSLAISFIDQFIRASIQPVLNEIVSDLTRTQAQVNGDAIEREVQRRLSRIADASRVGRHEALEDADPTDSEGSHQIEPLRLGIEIADAFSPNQTFQADARKYAERNCSPSSGGVDVMSVEHGSIAQRCGLVVGDRILRVNGMNIENAVEFVSRIQTVYSASCKTGAPLAITLGLRSGDQIREIRISH